MLTELIAGAAAFGLTAVFLPGIIRWARSRSVLDFPTESRRAHSIPTPRLGGVAIFFAIIAVCVATLLFDASLAHRLRVPIWSSMALGGLIVFTTGLIDDLRGLSPLSKLLGHSTAAALVMASGFSIDSITLAGGPTLHLGILAVPLTLVWIVGLTNAFNLIDGVDGLAATFASIGVTLAIVVQLILLPPVSIIPACAVLGSLLAFLRYNNSPARIFLGDCGSTLLGYYLSLQLVLSASDATGRVYLLIPLFALAYPLSDTAIAVARRWLRGDPLSRADGRHIHHQLLALGLSHRRTVDVLGFVFVCIAVTGISIAFTPPRITLALATGACILLFAAFTYSVRWLRYHEFSEFAASVASVLLNARSHVQNRIRATDLARRIEQADSLDQLSLMLGSAAGDLGLVALTLHTTSNAARPTEPPPSATFLRVDCLIRWFSRTGQQEEAVLRLSCARPKALSHFGVERLANHLAPAVQRWFERQAGVHAGSPKNDALGGGARRAGARFRSDRLSASERSPRPAHAD